MNERIVELNGIRKNCKEWARSLGISPQAFVQRLNNSRNSAEILRPKRIDLYVGKRIMPDGRVLVTFPNGDYILRRKD